MIQSQNHNTGKFPRTEGHCWSQMIWLKKEEEEKEEERRGKTSTATWKIINIEKSLLGVQRGGQRLPQWVRITLYVMSQPLWPGTFQESHISCAVGASTLVSQPLLWWICYSVLREDGSNQSSGVAIWVGRAGSENSWIPVSCISKKTSRWMTRTVQSITTVYFQFAALKRGMFNWPICSFPNDRLIENNSETQG